MSLKSTAFNGNLEFFFESFLYKYKFTFTELSWNLKKVFLIQNMNQ